MECLICGKDELICIHKEIRDISDITLMKCKECGMF